jgi:hypothetical protein
MLITDGKSHALDVQALSQSGRRFTVVLVGEDSLEANVGHLAALTGGDIFVASGSDLRDIMIAAIQTLRRPCEAPARVSGELRELKLRRGNTSLSAEWRTPTGPADQTVSSRAVAAVSASLALPALESEAAAALAETEGLVTHLTSLVLLDEAAKAQTGVPATRKIALPTPRTSHVARAALCAPAAFAPALSFDGFDRFQLSAERLAFHPPIDLSNVGSQIDWDGSPNQLLSGDLSKIDPVVVKLIECAARNPTAMILAHQLGIDVIKLILALVARSHAPKSRSAARIARAILGATATQQLDALSTELGLEFTH